MLTASGYNLRQVAMILRWKSHGRITIDHLPDAAQVKTNLSSRLIKLVSPKLVRFGPGGELPHHVPRLLGVEWVDASGFLYRVSIFLQLRSDRWHLLKPHPHIGLIRRSHTHVPYSLAGFQMRLQ